MDISLPVQVVCAWEFGLARRVRPSRPASGCSFSTLRLNLVLTHHGDGIPPIFRGGVHYYYYCYAIGSVPSLSGHHAIAYQWRALPRVRRHRANNNLKVVPVTVIAASLQVTMMDQLMCASYSTSSAIIFIFLKRNQNAPRPSEHPPVMGKKCQNV